MNTATERSIPYCSYPGPLLSVSDACLYLSIADVSIIIIIHIRTRVEVYSTTNGGFQCISMLI